LSLTVWHKAEAKVRGSKAAGGLGKFAHLDTTVTVIDAFTMMNDFDTSDLLSSRRDDVTPEDERTVSDLMVDQIEFADVIILNKIDMVRTSFNSDRLCSANSSL
jgi:G3E family GTPase